MQPAPYRSPAEKPEPPQEPKDEASVLGALRSTHAALPLWRGLLPAIAVVVILILVAIVLAPSAGAIVFAIVLPSAALLFLVLGWSPLRARALRVDLHANGVVVTDATRREVIAFEDVDEVWYDMDSLGTPVPLIRAIVLVDHQGAKHPVPLTVQNCATIAQWITRQCSDPLMANAVQALRSGETLTFGQVEVDRTGIRTRSWATRWSDLRLVRIAPGRVHLFRRQTVFPWRTVRHDQVPHPSIFVKLVTECAQKVEHYEPYGSISKNL
ncbi:hypothetical protein LVJ94_31375 [Pendulispora rubella]|uniref:Uncharacterized protein n=1 Tax=Pendulispora rubella TaxID=2741070 RepID=A0ABZ2KWM2_9BACT